MSKLPCPSCGLPRGRGSRCTHCGHEHTSRVATAPRPAPASRPAPAGPAPPAPRPAPARRRPTAPQCEGVLVAIAATPPQRGDRPWWGALLTALAVIPGLLALFVLYAVRRLTRLSSRSSRRRLLLAGGLGGLAGYRLGRRHGGGEHTALRVRTAGGEAICRCACPPASLSFAPGDDIAIWGRLHPDGVTRARRLENRTAGARQRIPAVRPWVPFAAAVSLVLCIAALNSITRHPVL